MRHIATILVLFLTCTMRAQTCAAAFSHTVDQGGYVYFLSTSTGTAASTVYTWEFQSALTPSVGGANLTQPAMNYTVNGTYNVTLTIFNPSTSCSSSTSNTLAILSPTFFPCHLNPNFSYTNTNTNGLVGFGNATTGSLSTTSYTWGFGDGTSAVGINANHYYATTGTYTAYLLAENPLSTCKDSLARVITVTNICALNLNVSPGTGPCSGTASASFSANACSTASLSYTWSNGATTPTVGGLCAGNYSITVSGAVTGSNCCSVAMGTFNIPTCTATASFSYTQGANGQVNIINTSTGSSSTTTYFWNFGNGSTSTSVSPIASYTSNGTYVVSYTMTTGACTSISTQTIVVNSYCTLGQAAFSYTSYSWGDGTILFNNNTVGTTSNTTYMWQFGDGSTLGPCLCPSPSYTYASNGPYNVTLTVSNGSTCTVDTVNAIVVNNVCGLVPGFTYTSGANWLVNFTSTFTGTNTGTTFFWDFGDGQSGTGSNPAHSYSGNGVYTVIHFATSSGPQSCTDSIVDTVNVNSFCSLTAAFNHTVNATGTVAYVSVSNGANLNTQYHWNFGDGYTGTGNPVTHGYLNGGAHLVTLNIIDTAHAACKDSVVQSVNITGINCSANANFSLSPTNVLHYWNATPAYPWNVTAATWNWGDGSSSTTLYASHQYSTAGFYSICLSTTVSCGASSSVCSTKQVYRQTQEAQVVYVNVVPPKPIAVGIGVVTSNAGVQVFPNPAHDEFMVVAVNLPGSSTVIELYNLMGQKVLTSEAETPAGTLNHTVSVEELPAGIYYILITGGGSPGKIIVSH